MNTVKKRPFVSVLTPTYNRRDYIPQFLKYFKQQTFPQSLMELVVIDDGEDKVKDLFKGLNNVVYIYSKKRLTVGKKRNMLNRYAKGYIRIHMDDDDYYPPNKVAHAVKKLMNSDRLIAGCSLTFCYIIKNKLLYKSGPFNRNHGIDGTFAYKKEYTYTHSYDEHKKIGLETKFTNKFTEPMIQLHPMKTILRMVHDNMMTSCIDRSTKKPANNMTIEKYIHHKEDVEFYHNLTKKMNEL